MIARNSSFVYKGKAVDVKRAARELGVRYVLEGSVRKGGNRVRITAQLIDATTGNHIWADRYDGELTDVFELQDEITRKVVAAIEPKLLEAEAVRSRARSPEDLGAWDLVMQANSVFWRITKTDIDAAIVILSKATELYPGYAPAYSMLAFALLFRAIPVGVSRSQDLEDAAQLASRAAELDDSDPWAHLALGWTAVAKRRTQDAVVEFQRALDINPNFAAAHGHLGSNAGLRRTSGQSHSSSGVGAPNEPARPAKLDLQRRHRNRSLPCWPLRGRHRRVPQGFPAALRNSARLADLYGEPGAGRPNRGGARRSGADEGDALRSFHRLDRAERALSARTDGKISRRYAQSRIAIKSAISAWLEAYSFRQLLSADCVLLCESREDCGMSACGTEPT